MNYIVELIPDMGSYTSSCDDGIADTKWLRTVNSATFDYIRSIISACTRTKNLNYRG